MSHILVKQPNGKWAIFSTIVDDFILIDATEKEYIKYELSEKEISLRKYIEYIKINPHYLWVDAIEKIERIHGKEHIEEILKDIT